MSQTTDYKIWLHIEKHVTTDGAEHWEDVDCAAPAVPCENIHQARRVAEHMAAQGENEQQRLSNQSVARARRRKAKRNGLSHQPRQRR